MQDPALASRSLVRPLAACDLVGRLQPGRVAVSRADDRAAGGAPGSARVGPLLSVRQTGAARSARTQNASH